MPQLRKGAARQQPFAVLQRRRTGTTCACVARLFFLISFAIGVLNIVIQRALGDAIPFPIVGAVSPLGHGAMIVTPAARHKDNER
jgi:hypothetical protein